MDLWIEHVFRQTLLSRLGKTKMVVPDLGHSGSAARLLIDSLFERNAKHSVAQLAIHVPQENRVQSVKESAHVGESLRRVDPCP